MNSIITKIYTGELPAFDGIMPKSKTYSVTQDKIVEILELLETYLPEQEKKTLETMDDLYWTASSHIAHTSFECGFRFAFGLACELFLEV